MCAVVSKPGKRFVLLNLTSFRAMIWALNCVHLVFTSHVYSLNEYLEFWTQRLLNRSLKKNIKCNKAKGLSLWTGLRSSGELEGLCNHGQSIRHKRIWIVQNMFSPANLGANVLFNSLGLKCTWKPPSNVWSGLWASAIVVNYNVDKAIH